MKITDHIDQDLLTHKKTYPDPERLIKKFGPRFEHPLWNRAGDSFHEGKVDILRSYKGDDVYAYSSKPKTYIIPSAASIRVETWPWAKGLSKDPRIDVKNEPDAIRDIGNQGSKILAPGLIDADITITSTRKYKTYGGGVDPVTGAPLPDDWSASNDWTDSEIPHRDRRSLPARTFVAYEVPGLVDANGDPEPRTMLIYTGESKGVQYDDGCILLYFFVPSPEHPLTILAGS